MERPNIENLSTEEFIKLQEEINKQIEDICAQCSVELNKLLNEQGIKVTKIDINYELING